MSVASHVGLFTSIDPDAGNTFTYSLVTGSGSTDNALFSIVGNSLNTGAVFDYETRSSYNIRVRTTDQGGLSTEQAFTISVTDVNEAPTAVILSASTVQEISASGTDIGILSTTDPDAGNTFTYSLVTGSGSTDNALFSIVGNLLNTGAVFDYETRSSYNIRVRTTDQSGLSTEQAFTISVTDVNETPTAVVLSASTVPENSASGTGIGILSTTDQDAGNTFTYSLVTGTGSTDNGLFTLVGSTIQTSAVFDYETRSSYSVRVRTTDQGGLFAEQAFMISVTDVNETPTAVVLSASTVAENSASGTVIGNLSTTDPDAGNTFTYSLVTGTGSTDNGSFTIVGNTLKTAAVFDYETRSSYSVRVRTTDQGGLFTEQAFTVTVTDVNEAPSGLSISASSVAENNASGTLVGSFNSTDPDAGNTFTYSLVTGTGSIDNGSFQIVGNTLKTVAVLDYELKPNCSIRVRITDGDGLSTEQVFVISVADINEGPTGLAISSTLIAENSVSGATVGAFSTTDPDAGNTFTYALVGGSGDGDNGSFTIVGNTLKTASVFDYETRSSYSLRVRTNDQGGLFTEQAFTITVTDVNEAPSGLSLSVSSIAENSPAGTVVGLFSSSDPDAGNTFTYTLVTGLGSTDNSSFTVVGNSLKTAAAFDFEIRSSYSVMVRTTDQSGLEFDQLFTIAVTDTNEGPLVTGSPSGQFTVNQTMTLSAFTVSDPDLGTGGLLDITVTANRGKVTVGATTAQSVSFAKKLAEVNQMLSGIKYTPALDAFAMDAVTVTAQDRDAAGAVLGSWSMSMSPSTGVIARIADPGKPGKFSLVVQGSLSADSIVVRPTVSTSTTAYTVSITGIGSRAYTGITGRILVYGFAGNDTVNASAVKIPALIYGGDGDDITLGGSAADILWGGGGNDLMVGGAGTDALYGEAGNDMLVDGNVALKSRTDTLDKVLATWNSLPAPTTTIYTNITSRITATFDKPTRDTLQGGAGTDWFWSATAGAVVDVTDLVAGERRRII